MKANDFMLFFIVKSKIQEVMDDGFTKDKDIINKTSQELHLPPSKLKDYLTHKTLEAIREIK
jgi:hypothetical protein